MKGNIVVGISCSHDASACLLRDGELICAIQLERLTRVKRDGRPYLNTRLAVDYCLHAFGLSVEDVDLFAFNVQNVMPQNVGLCFPLADESFDLFDPVGERSVFVSHHLSHAFAAFFSSPFEHAAVFIADGSGGSVVGADDLLITGKEYLDYINLKIPPQHSGYHVQSIYTFNQDSYTLLERESARSFHPMCGSSSLGETYAAVSQYVFGDWQEGGKLMGLAPYGQAQAFSASLLEKDESGLLQFSSQWKQSLNRANQRADAMHYKDLAARVQNDLETALLQRVDGALKISGETCLAYAGGLALNSVANQRILCETNVEQLYVMPSSHDAGICIGAAAAGNYLLTGKIKGKPVSNDFHGRQYSPIEVDKAISDFGKCLRVDPCDINAVAKELEHGRVIGWFEKGSEFGPRALGHRSILAAPFEKDMWLSLNKKIKFREEFRPYAPIVLAEYANEYFDMGDDSESPYMLRVVNIKPEWRQRLGAVAHVDGTARVQTVDKIRTPKLYALLAAFGDLTGVPILVNTSMNVRDEPIAETPEDALAVLLSTHMDALVLEEQFVWPVEVAAEQLENCGILCGPRVTLQASSNRGGGTIHTSLQGTWNVFYEYLSRHFLCVVR